MTRQPSHTATDHCVYGITRFLNFQADAIQHIDASIEADTTLVLPRLVKAWMLHGSRDASHANTVDGLLSEVDQSNLPTDSRESALMKSLKFSRTGNGVESARILQAALLESPTDLLLHQLVHEEIFWLGQAGWMRSVTEQAASAWNETVDGYSNFLSLRAFACEEAGYLDDAERYGRMAVEINPSDIWGAHAVAHVLTMQGSNRAGIDWLENLSGNWRHANQMKHHLWWHVCLFLFELGEHDRLLELLTSHIRNPDSSLVQSSPAAPIDLQNYSSLLLRLELYGVDVGDHWNTLGSICADRVNNHGNAFGNIHDMMVLAATGQHEKAKELLASMQDVYTSGSGSVAQSYIVVGIPACKAMLAHFQKDFDSVISLLGGVRHNLALIGASHAQRDLFYHMLVYAADKTGRDDLRAILLNDVERIGYCRVPDRAAYKICQA